jgi:hypothetical protein
MHRRRAGAFIWIAAIVVFTVPSVASAQSTTGVTLSVRRGIGGYARHASSNPLEITISSTRFFSGVIEVSYDEATEITRLPVEVPGGSKKVITVVIARAEVMLVRAVDRKGKEAAHTALGGPVLTNGQPLIGVFGAQPVPTRVHLPMFDATVPVVAVSAELLAQGVSALRPLSHLVVDPASAARLSDAQRDALAGFVIDGGGLIVPSATITDLDFLPASMRPAIAQTVTHRRVAQGDVAVVPVGFGDPRWRVDGPTWRAAVRPLNATRWLYQPDISTQSWTYAASELNGRRTGPVLRWLKPFLITYVALAGPVAFLALGWMRRRDLVWVIVPVIAFTFTGLAYGVGHAARGRPELRAGGVVTVDRGGLHAMMSLVSLSTGDDQKISLPAGWTVTTGSLSGSSTTATVEPALDRTDVDLRLGIGEYGLVLAKGTAARNAADPGTLTASGARLTGRVTNTAPFALRDVEVVLADSREPLGTLEAGDSTTVSVTASGVVPGMLPGIFSGSNAYQYGYYGGYNGPGYGPLNPRPAGLRAVAGNFSGAGGYGRPMLTGWADYRDVSDVLGLPKATGPVFIVIPLGITADGAPATFDRMLVSSASDIYPHEFGPATAFHVHARGNQMVVRWQLPDGMKPRPMTLSLGEVASSTTTQGGTAQPIPQFVPKSSGGSSGSFSYVYPVPGRTGPATGASLSHVDVSYFDPLTESWRPLRLNKASTKVPSSAIGTNGDVLVRVQLDYTGDLFPEGLYLS